MAGALKPEGVKLEAQYKIWGYNLVDPAENLFNESFTEPFPGPYAGTSMRTNMPHGYWYSADHFLDIEFYQDVAIWDLGGAGSYYGNPLDVYDYKNDSFVTQLERHDQIEQWKKIGELPKGRYVIKQASGARASNEWYLEAINSKTYLIKTPNKIYTLSDTNVLDDITPSIGDANNLTKKEWEDYGFTDLSPVDQTLLSELNAPIKLLTYQPGVSNTDPPLRLRQQYSLNVGVRTMITKPL